MSSSSHELAFGIGDLTQKLIARLPALSNAHSLILPAPDAPSREAFVELRSLFGTLLAPYEHEHLIPLQRSDVVPGHRVSDLALMWRELASNAAKYSAPSIMNGRLVISKSYAENQLYVTWTKLTAASGLDQL